MTGLVAKANRFHEIGAVVLVVVSDEGGDEDDDPQKLKRKRKRPVAGFLDTLL